jgi:HSP20 family protein
VDRPPSPSRCRSTRPPESLDVDNLSADCDAGVLTIKIPVAEQAKPRKVLVSGGSDRKQINA